MSNDSSSLMSEAKRRSFVTNKCDFCNLIDPKVFKRSGYNSINE